MADYGALPMPRPLAEDLRLAPEFKDLDATKFNILVRTVERAYVRGYSDGHAVGYVEGWDHRKRDEPKPEEPDRG